MSLQQHKKFITVNQLVATALSLRGYSLEQLARLYNFPLPIDNINNIKAKGWSGLLLEHILGASSGSLPQPDFPDLNLELKTIPIDKNYQPMETTYVCTAQLLPSTITSWDHSVVKAKLNQVLWLPLINIKNCNVIKRIVGKAVLWQPKADQYYQLKADYNEIINLIINGNLDKISGTFGTYLHLRPKAMNSAINTYTVNSDGKKILTNPRGFYLRTSLTKAILHD